MKRMYTGYFVTMRGDVYMQVNRPGAGTERDNGTYEIQCCGCAEG